MSEAEKMRLLVVGVGSVGNRHLDNFSSLGVGNLAAVDTRDDRLAQLRARRPDVETYLSLEEALRTDWTAAVICTPTAYHTAQARACVERGVHVLVEKPISDRLDGVQDVIRAAATRDLVYMVGYTYRFWPPLRKVKAILDSGVLGRALSANIVFSQYLPDWHPWEDYRSWFMASAAEGGGALLDESHAIDLARWIFGEVSEVLGATGRVSSLEISSDDFAHLLLGFSGGCRAVLQLDLLGRKAKRRMEVTCERGELLWDFANNRIETFDAATKEQVVTTFTCERNDMFVAEAEHFLAAIGGRAAPCVSGDDALETLQVLLKAKAGYLAAVAQ